jgi:hypothetical protein
VIARVAYYEHFFAGSNGTNRGLALCCEFFSYRRQAFCLFMADERIQLLNRAGVVVGCMVVDAADYALLCQWTWRRQRQGGYACRFDSVTRRTVYAHRVILGDPPFKGAFADHINRNSLDNRRGNLRWVSKAQNNQNVSIHKTNRSGHRAVHFDTRDQRWRGEVRVNGRKVWRRYFDDRETAALATADARRALLPFATA